MSPRDVLQQALAVFVADRLRTALTLLGVVWGAASVVFLSAWGEGVHLMTDEGFSKAGRNAAVVWPGRITDQYKVGVHRRSLWFEPGDVEALRNRARLSDVFAAENRVWVEGSARGRTATVDLRGIDLQMQEIRGVAVAAGRLLTKADLASRRRVVVLGTTASLRLIGDAAAVGRVVRLGGTTFEVVGVLEPTGAQLWRDRTDIDEQAWMPLSAFWARWPDERTTSPLVHTIFFRVRDRRLFDDAAHEVRAILGERLRVPADDEAALPIFSSVDALNRLGIERFTTVLRFISVATLAIGGLGILTMMLDAVYERRMEIGLRRSIGARRRDVVAQILVEVVLLTTASGACGVALGAAGCLSLAALGLPDLVPVPILRPAIMLGALVSLLSVALLASLLPTIQASRVEPGIILRQG